MATSKKKSPSKTTSKKSPASKKTMAPDAALSVKPLTAAALDVEEAVPAVTTAIPEQVRAFLNQSSIPKDFVAAKQVTLTELRSKITESNVSLTVSPEQLLAAVNRIKPAAVTIDKLPEDVKESIPALKPRFAASTARRFRSTGSRSPGRLRVRRQVRLHVFGGRARGDEAPVQRRMQALLNKLGDMMGDPGRDPNSTRTTRQTPASPPYPRASHTSASSSTTTSRSTSRPRSTPRRTRTPSTTCGARRSTSTRVYGRGPASTRSSTSSPTAGPSDRDKATAGHEPQRGPGGPAATATPAGMACRRTWTCRACSGTNTAIIGDPRNDENLIVVQFHHAMLRFHNAVVDLLVAAAFAGDIFAEAKRIVTHHYQWAVVHDFLEDLRQRRRQRRDGERRRARRQRVPHAGRVRRGRVPLRPQHDPRQLLGELQLPNATLGQVFEFNRKPRLPVFSNWVVDFNAFFDTGIPVPIYNKARKIDSFLANGLESLPGGSGLMAMLAARNLRRGLALGLPSGQGMANSFGIPPHDPRAVDPGASGRGGRAAQLERRRAAEADAALVLRAARGRGARRAATSSGPSAAASSPRRSSAC